MKLMKNVIVPLAAILLLGWLGQYIYIVDNHIDCLRLCLVFGIPFGIPYMLWVIPIGGNPEASVALLVVNVIVGALFGCLIAVFAFLRALIYIVRWIATPRGNR